MKKLLLIAFIASCFGCSKSSSPTPNQNSWVIGKWKATVRYEYNQSTQKSDTVTISNELIFKSSGICTDQNGNNHSYKLGSGTYGNTLNIYNGDCPMIRKGDNQFWLSSQLISPDRLVIYNITDVYNRE